MKKWYRSTRDKKLTGLCGGIGEMLNVDATLIRILLIVFTIFTSGLVIFVYIIASAVVPKEPTIYTGFGPDGRYGGGSGNGGFGGNGYHNPFGNNPNAGGPYKNPPYNGSNWDTPPSAGPQFDSMMDDLEKKALRKEIDQLKEKLAKLEKGDL